MKIHIVSNPIILNSGFGIVARNLAIGLKKLGYDVDCTGMQQSFGPNVYYGIQSFPLLGTNLDEISQLIMNIRDSSPDIVLNIFQSDSGDFREHAFAFDTVNRLNEAAGIKKIIKSIWYTPVESFGLAYNSIRDLKEYIGIGGKVVAQCKWGQREMKKEGIENVCIYHGVDNKIFRPLCNKEIDDISRNNDNIQIMRWIENRWVEETIKPNQLISFHKNKFVYLVVAANIGVRKRLERAMRAYYIFLEKEKRLRYDTILHIHSNPFNPEGIRLLNIAEKLNIKENTIFSYGKWKIGWDESVMSILYNSSGCHLSGSSGEGFGIGTLESMACGIPTIGPKNTSFIELIYDEQFESKNRGILVGGDYQLIIDGSYRFLVNEEKLAEAMNKMYAIRNSNEYQEYKKNCLDFAKRYTWEKICLEWDKLHNSMI